MHLHSIGPLIIERAGWDYPMKCFPFKKKGGGSVIGHCDEFKFVKHNSCSLYN